MPTDFQCRGSAPGGGVLVACVALLVGGCGDLFGPGDTEGPTVALDPLPELTNQTSVEISGSIEPQAQVEISGSAEASASTEADGSFSVPVTLAENTENTLVVVGIDSVGNRGPADTAVVVHDGVAPAAPALDSLPAYVAASTVAVAGTAEAGARVILTTDADSTDVAAGDDGGFSADLALAPNADNIVRARAEDAAGNVGDAASATLVHDDIAPTLGFTDPSPGETTPAAPDSFRVALSYDDGGSGVVADSLRVVSDRTVIGLLGQDGTIPDSIPAGSDLRELFAPGATGAGHTFGVDYAWRDGSATVAASVADRAGNRSAEDSVTFQAASPATRLMVINSSAAAGETGHAVPIGLINMQDLGGLDFTVAYDSAAVTVDSVAGTARVSFGPDDNADTHGSSGAVSVVLLDIDGDSIPAGQGAVVELFVTVADGASAGDVAITLSEVTAAGGDGTKVPILTTDGRLTIQ